MFDTVEITEGAALGDVTQLQGTRYKVRLIEGNRLGSSGYYPAETLLRDGPKVFKKGTPMYLDHQLPDEKTARPFGTIDTFAGELAEDAYYENDGLYAEIEVFEHQAPKIKALKDKIGISIRAKALSSLEVVEGKRVPVFKELLKARSADFVVRAGAGGKIVSILESATEESETPSEAEEGRENMDEVLEAIKGLRADVETRLTNLEEAAKPKKEEVEESKDAGVEALEIAEAFVDSTLDKEGKQRVLKLYAADKSQKISELIEAEESYVKRNSKPAENEGVEESADDVEESAKESKTVELPRAWKMSK